MTEQKNQDDPRQSQWLHEIAQQSKQTVSFDDPDKLRNYVFKYCEINGWDSDLNHIDVSRMISMNSVFKNLPFTGDISRWDVSKVGDMSHMFHSARFNGDISQWNLQHLMFYDSMFSGSSYANNHPDWRKELHDQIIRSQHQEANQSDETRGIHR